MKVSNILMVLAIIPAAFAAGNGSTGIDNAATSAEAIEANIFDDDASTADIF
ncbi:hypothetical protein HDU81_010212, partial [Chytriomyces hyalinus]